MGILFGYSEVGYRVLLGGKITIARHVEVIGTDTKCIGVAENSLDKDNDDIEDNDLLVNMNKEELESREDENDNSLESLNIPGRSTRNKRTPVRYPEKENISEIHANYCSVDIPCTFEEAICCEDSEDWKQAMDKEIECLYKNKTWKLVERVKGKDVLDVKWVYTRKSDDRYKARLVVRGFQQRNIADDMYSPVASNQTFKILLSYCCQNGLIIEQMNVETAFLNGEVTSEVYVNQPKGYADGTNRVCKLSKALYGLKESPRD